MHTVYVIETPEKRNSLLTMLVGQVGTLKGRDSFNSAFNHEVVMRTNAGLINLSHPERSANLDYYSGYEVELFEAGTKLELRVGESSYPTIDSLTVDQRAEIKRIRVDNKILAIKRVREITGSGLRDAKEFVDSL